jgi:preprotein translocase subunit SecG
MAISLLVLGALALVFAVFVQTQASDAASARSP